MTEQLLKTSKEWQDQSEQNIAIVDPDGWDRTNFDFSFYQEKISHEEFQKRLVNSSLIIIAKP